MFFYLFYDEFLDYGMKLAFLWFDHKNSYKLIFLKILNFIKKYDNIIFR